MAEAMSSQRVIHLLEKLEKAVNSLTEQLTRYNDAHEPVKITNRTEADFGRAEYGESAEQKREREELETALNAPLHPFYSESVQRMKMKQGLPFIDGAPVGIDGTYNWIKAVGEALKLDPATVERVASEERRGR